MTVPCVSGAQWVAAPCRSGKRYRMGGDNDWDPDWDAIAARAAADGPAENAKEIRLQQPTR